MYKFFILSGASSAGKTTSLNALVKSGLCEKAPKYSEREERGDTDDIIHVDDIYDTAISCDVIYTMYNNKYGINTTQIKDKLKLKHQIAVVSDIMSLKELKRIFNEHIIVIYILSDKNIVNFITDYIDKNKLNISREDKDKLFYSAHNISNAIEKQELKEFVGFNKRLRKDSQRIFERHDDFIKRYKSLVSSYQLYVNNRPLYDHRVLNDKDVSRITQCADIIRQY